MLPHSAAKRQRGPADSDLVAELTALAERARALSSSLPAHPADSEREALAALQAAQTGLQMALAVSLEESALLRLPPELLVRMLSFLDAAGMARVGAVCTAFRPSSDLVAEALPRAAARVASAATVAVVPRGSSSGAGWLAVLKRRGRRRTAGAAI